MLEQTFIHIPSFGPKKERRMWRIGIKSWADFISRFGTSPYHQGMCAQIQESIDALNDKNGEYFSQKMPKNEMWRCFPHFEKVAYLDIETTGLGNTNDHVTVVGIYDGKEVKSYIHEQNIDQMLEDIKAFDSIVTFNGSLFDIPFLKRSYPSIKIPAVQIDLRFVLSSIDVRGGLKKIEQQFGFEREDDLKGLNGYDAVLLWRKYRRDNDKEALDKLVRYNAADISNLKKLMEWAYSQKRSRCGIDESLINTNADN